jgi:predicted NUDIX family NTP pyrophosphohydrolase
LKESAGTLLYRFRDGALQVLIVHPSGAYNRRAPWSIPKGKLDPGETREAAARRETVEETGVQAGDLVDLGSVELVRSGKRIHGFAGPAPEDAQPRCASWEVDRAEFVGVDRARELLHPDQAPFVDWLVTLVGAAKT